MNNIIFNKTEYRAKSVCNGKDVMGMRTDCMGMAGVLGQRIACSGEVSCGLETAERALTKIENDLGGCMSASRLVTGESVSRLNAIGTNSVRIISDTKQRVLPCSDALDCTPELSGFIHQPGTTLAVA